MPIYGTPTIPRSPLAWVAGRYYGAASGALFGGSNTQAMTANRLYAAPFYVPKHVSGVIDRIGIELTFGVASALGRVGVYTMGSNGLPRLLISGTDVGTLDFSSTGGKQNTVALTLPTGQWCFLAVVSDSAVTVRADNGLPPAFGTPAITTTTAEPCPFMTHTFAALPATFTVDGYHAGSVPRVLVRAA